MKIKNKFNENLDYEFHDSDNPWVVVIGHGVTAHKDRPLVLDTVQALRAANFSTLHFSFSGNGHSEGRFEDATISKELDDLDAVLSFLEDKKQIAYIGHSMGGAVGVLKAANDVRIQRLITHAGMVETKHFYTAEFGDLKPDIALMWDEPHCPLSSAFKKDLCETIASTAASIPHIRQAWLLLHGTQDSVVPISDSQKAHALCAHSEMVTIEGGDHLFNKSARDDLLKITVEWLIRNTNSEA